MALSKEAAVWFLGNLRGHGLPPSGSFFAALWEAMMRASGNNLIRFQCGFPDEYFVVDMYKHHSGGYKQICEIAGVPPGVDL
jgi:hypothetical protein